MASPNVVCLVTDLTAPVDGTPEPWRQHSLIAQRHQRLVQLADDLALVDQYRTDARPPGSVRECIEDTTTCYDPGIALTTGPLSSLGAAAYALYIPPETDGRGLDPGN